MRNVYLTILLISLAQSTSSYKKGKALYIQILDYNLCFSFPQTESSLFKVWTSTLLVRILTLLVRASTLLEWTPILLEWTSTLLGWTSTFLVRTSTLLEWISSLKVSTNSLFYFVSVVLVVDLLLFIVKRDCKSSLTPFIPGTPALAAPFTAL